MSRPSHRLPKVRPGAPPRKIRTREHVIADLSANHVERHVLRCGWSAEKVRHDYGFDLTMVTYNSAGEIENGVVYLQLKATDVPRYVGGGSFLAYPVERSDLEYWLEEQQPVILVVYDAVADEAFWLYIQAYFEAKKGFRRSADGKTITVRINTSNVVNETSVRRFAWYRDDVRRQQKGHVRHHA